MTLAPLTYHICPHCPRAVRSDVRDRYCSNDGYPLLTECRACGTDILSPFAEYCAMCGAGYRLPRAAASGPGVSPSS